MRGKIQPDDLQTRITYKYIQKTINSPPKRAKIILTTCIGFRHHINGAKKMPPNMASINTINAPNMPPTVRG